MGVPEVSRYPAHKEYLSFETPPSAAGEAVAIEAADGVKTRALLYAHGHEKTVVCIMHPRADMTRFYAAPAIVEAGYAFFAQQGRVNGENVGKATIHEHLLKDVAAGVAFLRARGFEKIVLLGNSGSAVLFTLYHSQAKKPAADRLTTTAAGDPCDLRDVPMSPADGFVYLGAHLGPGVTLQQLIDPSVTDETDPMSCDYTLDMYNPENGFAEAPSQSRYSDEFIARYRAAQQFRAGRIDATAWALVRDRQRAEREMQHADYARLSDVDRLSVVRRATVQRLMPVYRLEADPDTVDFSRRQSEREYGTLFAKRPDLMNYIGLEMASMMISPEVWLSTWSARYSRAKLLDVLPDVVEPVLVMAYTGDNAVLPSVAETIFAMAATANKEKAFVTGDHFGFQLQSKPGEGGRAESLKVVTDWLGRNFPS